MTETPSTLGEKLATASAPVEPETDGWSAWAGYVLANVAVLTLLTVLPFLWVFLEPDHRVFEAAMLGLVAFWALLAWIAPRPAARAGKPVRAQAHFLLDGDASGVMAKLRMDQKTALFDGSNLYHFGVANGLGAAPVGLIARQLRAEGYRIVCFFDANIFYTLIENGDYPAGRLHVIETLLDTFGLAANEVYVVPSGVQADKYILSTLNHLPISFAITNDQFRDYAKTYAAVMKGNLWRKGITISKNEIRLTGHRFKTPVRLGVAA